jgi:predicted AlkP superfamily phosphohydrolase/phosphomutase
MPDFFVIWNRESPIDRVGSPRVGEVEYIHRGNRTGDHSPASLFIAAGPGVTSGRVPNTSILDLAPTVAHLLDVDLPDVEGHRIEALEVDPDH